MTNHQLNHTVTIVHRRLTQYRAPFFNKLREKLAAQGVRLRLLVGAPTSWEASKEDSAVLDWAESLPTYYFMSGRLCWQPVRHMGKNSDLLIVTQENALLANHSLLLRRPAGRLAFWGHGANLQAANHKSLSERYKRWTTRQVDWWFAYTQLSVDLVANAGFPRSQITCLNNAIDVRRLEADWKSVTRQETAVLRSTLGLDQGFTGVFIGSLYSHKRLDFLISATDRIRAADPNFSLVIIGAGPEANKVRAMGKTRPWVHLVGARQGREKALFLSLGDVLLNPGLVGLNILDAFACRLPMITTDCGLHSPEIAYLNGGNGIMTDNSVDAFAQACAELAEAPERLLALRQGCAISAQNITVEKMVNQFAEGVSLALECPPKCGGRV